jgi:hypothetical protein
VKIERPSALPYGSSSTAILFRAILGVALLGSMVPRAVAQSADESGLSREYTIKAAYLYNFARYVQWRADAFRSDQDPFVIGVLGTDPLGDDLDRIAQAKQIEARKIVVYRFPSPDKYRPCHIFFVPRTVEPRQQIETIGRLRNSPVLLIGETPGFAERGGTINFFIEQNKVRFEINQQAAKRAGLKISAKLLSLAKLVSEDDGGREK